MDLRIGSNPLGSLLFVPYLFVDIRQKPHKNVGTYGGTGVGKLTALGVKNAGPGRHADGLGLYLLVKPSGARSWLLRVQVAGRRRDIGLGGLADLTLSEARDRAAELRKVARRGHDPIAERDKDKRPIPTFKEAAKACHGDLKAGWAPRNAAAFISSLKEHAYPSLGNMRVDLIEASHIRDMLAPKWLEIPVMARKVRQRVTAVLNYAKSKGWRAAEAPGKSVTMGLARQKAGGNFAAMPYSQVPDFVTNVRSKTETIGRLALQFLILTAARSGEVRSAKWSHIDLEGKVWNRPADLMKNRIAHTVTLSDPAIAVLKRAALLRTTEADCLIFPGKGDKAISDMTLTKVLRDAKKPFAAHGFRSSFRDWAAEQMPMMPEAVAEAALAHVVPDQVIRAYKRTSFLDMRRQLLDAWGRYVEGEDNIVRLAMAG
jgi:integrase